MVRARIVSRIRGNRIVRRVRLTFAFGEALLIRKIENASLFFQARFLYKTCQLAYNSVAKIPEESYSSGGLADDAHSLPRQAVYFQQERSLHIR